MYITVKQASEKWGISERRVRTLCLEGKVSGAYQEGRGWKIPNDAPKPTDGRFKSRESLIPVLKEKLKELKERRPLTKGELERLNEEFITEFTYNSNAIEGNTLTLRETDMVLRGLTIDKKPLREHLEVIGHRDAFDYVSELVTENKEITEKVIQDIHYLVLADKKEDRGRYRSIPVKIMGAVHDTAEPYLISTKIKELLEDYNNSTEELITKIARFHIEFEAIHPFIDGNRKNWKTSC